MSRILLIEADKLLADNISGCLKKAGQAVEWHVSPQAAMESADQQKPDLIILDLLLAGHGGLEFLFELRSYPEWQDLPVILFSHISEAELENSGTGLQQLKIAAFHHKPRTTAAELAASVEAVLARQPA